ncbi:hypothetical protein SASPL_143516 [Salvia splendens]|uniref:Uncharacterized protein n=1 Tax=Salvia splendens TaxID=180675 RepID=A0A8X8ZAX2_SALSN|nr:hypothetical protein SASPL_143516 [Salvia splendens]
MPHLQQHTSSSLRFPFSKLRLTMHMSAFSSEGLWIGQLLLSSVVLWCFNVRGFYHCSAPGHLRYSGSELEPYSSLIWFVVKSSMSGDRTFIDGDVSSGSGEEANMLDGHNKHHTVIPHSGRHKRSRKATGDAMLEIAAASKMRAAAIMRTEERFTISKCIRILDEMQGVDQNVYFFALDLFENPSARETFISLKSERRLVNLVTAAKERCDLLTGRSCDYPTDPEIKTSTDQVQPCMQHRKANFNNEKA